MSAALQVMTAGAPRPAGNPAARVRRGATGSPKEGLYYV